MTGFINLRFSGVIVRFRNTDRFLLKRKKTLITIPTIIILLKPSSISITVKCVLAFNITNVFVFYFINFRNRLTVLLKRNGTFFFLNINILFSFFIFAKKIILIWTNSIIFLPLVFVRLIGNKYQDDKNSISSKFLVLKYLYPNHNAIKYKWN